MTGKTFSKKPNTVAQQTEAATTRKAVEKPRTVDAMAEAAISNAEKTSEISRVGPVKEFRDVGEGRVEVTKLNGKTQIMPQRVGAGSAPAPQQYIKANTEANAALQAARSIVEDIQSRGMVEGPRKNIPLQQEQERPQAMSSIVSGSNPSLSQQSREYGRPGIPLPYTPPDDTLPYNRPGGQMTDRFQSVNTAPETTIFPTSKQDFGSMGEAARALYFQSSKANPSNAGRRINPPSLFTDPQVESIKQQIGGLGVDPDTFYQFTTKEGENIAGLRKGIDPRAVELPYKTQRQNPYEGTYRVPGTGNAEFAYTANLGGGKFVPVYSSVDEQGKRTFLRTDQPLARNPEFDYRGNVKGSEALPETNRAGFLEDGDRMQARLQRIGQNAKDAIEYEQAQRNKIGYAIDPDNYGSNSTVDEMDAVNSSGFPKAPGPRTDFAKTVTDGGSDVAVGIRGRDGKTRMLNPGLNIFRPGQESVQGSPAVGAFSRSNRSLLGKTNTTGGLSIAGLAPEQVAGLGIGSPATEASTRAEQIARTAANQLAVDRSLKEIQLVDGRYPDGTIANVLTKQGDAARAFGGMANGGAAFGKDGFSNEQLLYLINQDARSNGDLGNGKRGNRLPFETMTDDGDRQPLETEADREVGPSGAEELSDRYAMGSQELNNYSQVADGAATVQGFLDDIYGGQERLTSSRDIQGFSKDNKESRGQESKGYYSQTKSQAAQDAEVLARQALGVYSRGGLVDVDSSTPYPQGIKLVDGKLPDVLPDPNSPKAFMGSVMGRSVYNNNSRNEVKARTAGVQRNQYGAFDAPVLSPEGEYAVSQMKSVADNRKVADGRLPDENVERVLGSDGYLKTVKRPDEFKEPRLAGSPEYRAQIAKIQEGYPDIAKLFNRDDVEAFSTTSIDVNDIYNINSGEYEAQNLTRAEMPDSVSLRLGKGIEDGIYLPGINPGSPAEDFYPFGSTAVAGFGASGVADESGKAAGEKGRNFIENLKGTLGISRTREMLNPLTRETEIVPQIDLTGKTAMEAVGDRERAAKQQQAMLRRLTENEWNNGRTYKDTFGRVMAPNFNVLGPDGRPVHETNLEKYANDGLPEIQTLYDFVKEEAYDRSISGNRDYNMYEGDDPLAHLREYGEERPLNEALRAIPGNLLQQGYATQQQNNIYKKSKQIMDDYTTGTTTFNKTPQQAFTARYRDGTTETVIADLGLGEVMKIQGVLRNTDLPRLEPNLSGEMGPADPLGDMGQFAERVKKGQMTKDEYLTQAYVRLNNAAAIASVPGVQTERVTRPDAVLPSSRQVGLMFPGVEQVRTTAPEPALTEVIGGRRPDPRRQLMTGLKAVDQRFDTAFNAGDPDYGANYSRTEPGEAPMSESARVGKVPRTQEQMAQQRADDAEADAVAAARQKNIDENAARRKELEMIAKFSGQF